MVWEEVPLLASLLSALYINPNAHPLGLDFTQETKMATHTSNSEGTVKSLFRYRSCQRAVVHLSVNCWSSVYQQSANRFLGGAILQLYQSLCDFAKIIFQENFVTQRAFCKYTWVLRYCKFPVITLFARWRHFTTTTRILLGFLFILKFGSLSEV